MRRQSGFTLIELSIVLVIIGLIVGGILVGQDLIKAAEVRAQVSQIEKYNSAVNTFRGKYAAIPGDMSPAVANRFGFTPGIVCDGSAFGMRDSNGLLDGASPYHYVQGVGEVALFWDDISSNVAGSLIDGNFPTGFGPTCNNGTEPALSTTPGTAYIGNQYPAGKMGHGLFLLVYNTSGYNWYALAAITSTQGNGNLFASPVIPVIQAYNMDKKMDDGLPTTGTVQAMYLTGEAVTPASASTNDTTTSCYNTTNNAYSISSLASYGANGNCALSFRFQ